MYCMESIAVVTIPLKEWNEMRAEVKQVRKLFDNFLEDGKPEYLTAAQVCQTLNITRSTYERWRKEGKIPVITIGKKKYSKPLVKRTELEAMVSDGHVKAR